MTVPSVPDRPAAPAEAWIVDVDGRNFEREILERSLTVPVVVDFWATWCGPCKTLGPELEKRAREGKGRFVLAKVDIDRNPELAGAFRVQAVPTVLAVVQGRLVDGFQGALPAAELDEFFARIAPLPSASRADQRVSRAMEVAQGGQRDQGIGLLREILREFPEHLGARLSLAELLLDARRPRDARLVLEKATATGPDDEARIKALQTRLAFAETAGSLEELEEKVKASPGDSGARIELGKSLIAAGEHARGLEHLLEVVRGSTGELRDQAKKAMLESFEILGLQDKVANEYRFKLSLELFS